MCSFKPSVDDLDEMSHPGSEKSVPSPLAHVPKQRGKSVSRGVFRVITANVQSFPERAITPDQALEDLKRNAADGDLVFLQEIAARYRPLVEEAFPSPEWEVYYGEHDNTEPIAFRTALFTKVVGRVILLHRARAHLHFRRYITYVRLTFKPLGSDFHATNLHMVAGAFSKTPKPDKAVRVDEWNAGIAKHVASVEKMVRTGLPVVGGGDYNRQLKQHKSLGTRIAGKPVRYAVGKGSIDLVWFIDGDRARWRVRSLGVFPGRNREHAERHSDHAARQATVVLTNARVTTSPRPAAAPVKMPPPFELTRFGDGVPKRVDWKTRAALEEAQRRLGYPLTIVQGSYNQGGVAASGGTHDGGGVVDLLPWDWKNKVRVLRSIGFAAWHRPAIRGLWGEHIHAVLIDHGRLSRSAAAQVIAYRAGRDGLKGNRVDPSRRPSPIPVFEYPPTVHETDSSQPAEQVKPVAPARTAFPPKRVLDGVDTSHHQSGRFDLKKARAAGLRWWYVKATEGTTVVDPTYRKRISQARAEGIPVGSYHFARPDVGDGAAEAMFFLKHADIRPGDMLPMLDLEALEGLSPAQLTTWTRSWVKTVKRELARKGMVAKPIIYTHFDLGNAFGCLLWVARYSNDFRAPKIPKPWRRAAIWQHSDGRFGPIKRVPGMGVVDVNAVHPDVPLSALRIKAAVQPPAPAPPSASPSPGAPPPLETPQAELETLAQQLRAATRSLQVALDAIPER